MMGWTDERVSTLKNLWLDGVSAPEIAKQLGGVTRNAVIGKVHRLGLKKKDLVLDSSKQLMPRQKPETNVLPPNAPPALPVAALLPQSPPHRFIVEESPMSVSSVINRGERCCKWPIGDPGTESFRFCGGRVEGKGSYCDHHVQAERARSIKEHGRPNVKKLVQAVRNYA